MAIDLNSLLLDFAGCSEEQAIARTREVWIDEYMNKQTRKGQIGLWKTHDDIEVVFYDIKFEHAFFTSKDRSLYPDDKSKFDLERAKRVRWIRPVIEHRVDSVECWERPGYGRAGYLNRRLYVLWNEGYIVWLVKRDDGQFRFETAYCTKQREIRERYIRGGRKIKNTP